MKYFAMIDGERRGPFTLAELHEAGVRPDTYVWCKGMADWEKAEDVADICRFYRQRIFDLMHPPSSPASSIPSPDTSSQQSEDPYAAIPARFREYARRAGIDPSMFTPPQEEDFSRPPVSLITISIILIFFCFPPTGFIAFYYAYMCRKAWEECNRSANDKSKDFYSSEEKKEFARKAYNYERLAKMWCGITFFLGFIFYALLSRFINS